MIKEFIEKWDKNKQNLENYFRTTKQSQYLNYEDIVKALFDNVINIDKEYNFDTDDISIIDDGDYQGTQIFILHKDCYQPDIEDYIYTNTDYGSCSGCDTLLRIRGYHEDCVPDNEQIKDYMILALHLLQKCKYMQSEEENNE